MHKEHPIDDLFRNALGEAQVTPPPAVWEGIVRRRSEDRRTGPWFGSRWWWLGVLLLLGGGLTALVLKPWKSPTGISRKAEAGMPTPLMASTALALPTPDGTAAIGSASANGNNASSSTSDGPNGPRTTDALISQHPNTIVGRDGPTRGSEAIKVGRAGQGPLEPVALTSLLSDAYFSDRVSFSSPRRVLPIRSEPHLEQAPEEAPAIEHPVISSGNWLLGLEATRTWALDGEWRGDRTLADALNKSERPIDLTAYQLVFGRIWNSGFHLALGLGGSRRTTRFLGTTTSPGNGSILVDTTWSMIPAGTATYYTWDIDSVLILEPGVQRIASATNTYSAWRIGIECGQRWRSHRWMFGVNMGLAMHVEERREGQTLVIPAASGAGGMEMVPLGSGANEGLRALGVSGSVSLDVAYQLSDHIALHALPCYQQDLGSNGDPSLIANSLGGGVRLIYEFTSTNRPSTRTGK